ATFGPLTDVLETSYALTDVKGSDQPAMAVDKEGTIYAFTKERPPLSTAAGPTQGTLSPAPGPANQCRPSSSAPGAPTWNPTPPTSSPPVAGQPGAGARLLMSKSTDGGATWQGSVADSSGIVCVPCLTTPVAAVDPKTGAVYVVWEQSDSGPPGPRDDRNIWFMRSTDGGATWTKRVQLNDDIDPNRKPNYDQMFPGISIAPNGRIDIAWWDFRTDGLYNSGGNGNTLRRDQTCFDIYYTSSGDGGLTWARNSRISDRSMNQWEGLAMNPLYDLRGPIGVASTDEEAYVAWSDSRNGSFDLPTEDVYFATVVHEDEVGSTSGGSSIKASSLFLGLAIGIAIAGLVVLVMSRRGQAASPSD
ncbi:MAG: sialidase family protein, partial [Acidimicrobiales bacterium]